MQAYRSIKFVRAIQFNPASEAVYRELEELGCTTNRREGTARAPDGDLIRPLCYVVESPSCPQLAIISSEAFEANYELADEYSELITRGSSCA